MPVPLPNLDDRRWIDLVDEGRALIPLHARETWTDHNVHDPGITLIELFAWIAEMDIYQLNRVPDRHTLKFLSLVGLAPAPPRAARTVLSFALSETAPEPLLLPAGVEFAGSDLFGEETHFRTLEPMAITHAKLMGVFGVDHHDRRDLTERFNQGASFEIFGPVPQRGAELHLAFDLPLPVGQSVNLFFTFAGENAGLDARTRLMSEARERQRACEARGPRCGVPAPEPPVAEEPSVPPHHSVRVVWEYFGERNGQKVWVPLDSRRGEIDDDTRAFTLDGRVRIAVPGSMASELQGQAAAARYWLRARLESGAYDALPVIANLAMNAVAAEQAVAVGDPRTIGEEQTHAVRLGVSDGMPWQEFQLEELKFPFPVQQESFRLFTFQNGQWIEWQRRPDFDASGRADAHCRLDASAGIVEFGDGEHGQVPARNAEVYAAYRATRAEAGNLAANVVNKLPDSPYNLATFGSKEELTAWRTHFDSIRNPVAASNGAAAESLEAAEARAAELMETPQRAVTLSNFETLARATPGAALARVAARANLHPSFPCLKAQGLITLIVLPHLPEAKPMPSAGLRRAVAAYVGRRRIIGTRVEVVAPTYLEVAVRATVRASAVSDRPAVQRRIVAAVNTFLHPLEGGPEGTGWPFGRDVYRSEILQLIDQVAGVEHVLALDLIAADGKPQCGNVCLAPTWLVIAGPHRIEVT